MQPKTAVARRISVPLVATAALLAVYLFAYFEKPPWFDAPTESYLLACVAALAGITLLQVFSYLLLDVAFRKRKGREAPQLIRMVVSIAGYAAIFALVYGGVLGKDASKILATSAVLSVILGLALQDTLGNFFAGLSLQAEQPFHIGDALRVGDMTGRIESITWRATSIRTTDNSLVILPNSRIARDAIEVFSLHAKNRRKLRIPAPYGIAPERAIALMREAAGSILRISIEPQPQVRIAEFSDSAITYEILYWIEDYLWAHEIEAAIRERIWYAFNRHGIDIPFPIRQVKIEREETRASIPAVETENLLAGVEILKPLSAAELKEVANSAPRLLFGPGEMILHKGDSGDSMFVILRGEAEVLAADAEGNPQRVALLKAKNVIGEMALFTGDPRSADVRAVSELEIVEIHRPVIQHLLSANEALAEAFSQIIDARQRQLAAMSTSRSEISIIPSSETMLARIKKFFNLR
jgi:small-conductance mechanosensitive channel/CRP-like cAMP-binding protein